MAKGGQTPKDAASPEMKAAWQLKESGNVRGARREAARILGANPSPEDRAQAQELLARSATPPALFAFAGLALLVLLALVAIATRY